jgi:hypothetical protein
MGIIASHGFEGPDHASGDVFSLSDIGGYLSEFDVGSGTINYTSVQAHGGSLSLMISGATNTSLSGGDSYVGWNSSDTIVPQLTSGNTEYGRFYMRLPTVPSTQWNAVEFASGTVFAGAINVSAAGKLRVQNKDRTNLASGVNSLPSNQWIRVEWKLSVSGATAGAMEVKYWSSADSTGLPTEAISGVNSDFLTTVTDRRIGTLQTNATAPRMFLDDVALGTQSYIGPAKVLTKTNDILADSYVRRRNVPWIGGLPGAQWVPSTDDVFGVNGDKHEVSSSGTTTFIYAKPGVLLWNTASGINNFVSGTVNTPTAYTMSGVGGAAAYVGFRGISFELYGSVYFMSSGTSDLSPPGTGLVQIITSGGANGPFFGFIASGTRIWPAIYDSTNIVKAIGPIAWDAHNQWNRVDWHWKSDGTMNAKFYKNPDFGVTEFTSVSATNINAGIGPAGSVIFGVTRGAITNPYRFYLGPSTVDSRAQPGPGLTLHAVTANVIFRGNPSNFVDARLQEISSLSNFITASLKKTTTISHLVDARIRQTFSVSHSVDAMILVQTPVTHIVDAQIKQTRSTSNSVDAILIPTGRGIKLYTVDAQITQIGATKNHSVDAVVFKTQTVGNSVDAILYFSGVPLSHQIDAFLTVTKNVHNSVTATTIYSYVISAGVDAQLTAPPVTILKGFLTLDGLFLTNQGRTATINRVKITKDLSLASGGTRRYVKSIKKEFHIEWQWLPNVDSATIDNLAARDIIHDLVYDQSRWEYPLEVYDIVTQTTSNYRVQVVDYSEELIRREGGLHFYNASLTLREK